MAPNSSGRGQPSFCCFLCRGRSTEKSYHILASFSHQQISGRVAPIRLTFQLSSLGQLPLFDQLCCTWIQYPTGLRRMTREPAPSAVEGLLVCWAILAPVIAITIPTFDLCLLLWVFYDIVDCVGLLCRYLCHVLHDHLVIDEVQCLLKGWSGILDKQG